MQSWGDAAEDAEYEAQEYQQWAETVADYGYGCSYGDYSETDDSGKQAQAANTFEVECHNCLESLHPVQERGSLITCQHCGAEYSVVFLSLRKMWEIKTQKEGIKVSDKFNHTSSVHLKDREVAQAKGTASVPGKRDLNRVLQGGSNRAQAKATPNNTRDEKDWNKTKGFKGSETKHKKGRGFKASSNLDEEVLSVQPGLETGRQVSSVLRETAKDAVSEELVKASFRSRGVQQRTDKRPVLTGTILPNKRSTKFPPSAPKVPQPPKVVSPSSRIAEFQGDQECETVFEDKAVFKCDGCHAIIVTLTPVSRQFIHCSGCSKTYYILVNDGTVEIFGSDKPFKQNLK
mmetsp:Transcript_13233/g.34703  ORF Transcript_13233/g.34703 Transcript_13233/m.34703 type:complete len:346 (-) Transcript_13233:2009-3046(-)